MLFATYAKQQHAERNSSYAVAEEKSHNALAQLSASGVARKDERAGVVAPLQKIERSRCGITIRRGGSHRQTQRLERSIRTRSTVLGDPAVFCADFLYAEGCA